MKSTVRTVGTVMIIMILSRLTSLLSNMAYITFYGINLETDIYSYAIQLPNIFFNSLGTAIATVFIPIFAGYIGIGEKKRAFEFADNMTGISLVLTAGISLLGILFSPFILSLTRFKDNGYAFALASLRFMFPVIIFYALNYIFQGVLQSLERYNMPAFVSVPGSLLIILYIFVLGGKYGVKGLFVVTFIGLAMQALVLVIPVLNAGYKIKPSFSWKNEDIRKALKLVPPILIGTSAYQVNMLFNATLSANFKDAVAIITTVQNLVLYAVLAFIYSVTAVMFPRFTMLAAANDMDGFKQSFYSTVKSIMYFLIPSAAGLIAVRFQLIDFLYGWGRVTADNVSQAGDILAFYAVGVIGIGIKEVSDRAFFSLKDTKRPAIGGVVVMTVNVATSLILISFMGVYGIPLAYSISALSGAALLIFMINKKIGYIKEMNLLPNTFKVIAASVIMLVILTPLKALLGSCVSGQTVLHKGIRLFIPAAAGVTAFFVATYIMKVDETIKAAQKIMDIIKRNKKC